MIRPVCLRLALKLVLIFFVFLASCENTEPPTNEQQALPATIMDVETHDTPIYFEFVGQAESSRQVEIRARIDGFLENQVYNDGELVQAGQTLFELDKKPLAAMLQIAQGELALQKARNAKAVANLKRIRPLAEKDAVSKKDLDDAISAKEETQAAVLSAEGSVREAELKLSYATIKTPVTGQASKAQKQVGSYIPTGAESLLTYVAQLDPIWVNFSVSENQLLKSRLEEEAGRIQAPQNDRFEVEVVYADGRSHLQRGFLNFAEPTIDPQTGTMLIRAELDNPDSILRPGQFVRVRLHGAIRPQAILVPKTAVMQGSKGHFVWLLDPEGKAEVRAVEVGSWHGDDWFIDKGLQAGDRMIIDNLAKLYNGMPVIDQPAPAAEDGDQKKHD